MKAIVCGKCYDVRTLRVEHVVECACGNVEGKWVNPIAGTAMLYAKDRDRAKVMGIMNTLLLTAFRAYDYSSIRWRELHQEMCESAAGYMFHTSHRACPIVIAAVSNVTGVQWSDTPLDDASRHEQLRELAARLKPEDLAVFLEAARPVLLKVERPLLDRFEKAVAALEHVGHGDAALNAEVQEARLAILLRGVTTEGMYKKLAGLDDAR